VDTTNTMQYSQRTLVDSTQIYSMINNPNMTKTINLSCSDSKLECKKSFICNWNPNFFFSYFSGVG